MEIQEPSPEVAPLVPVATAPREVGNDLDGFVELLNASGGSSIGSIVTATHGADDEGSGDRAAANDCKPGEESFHLVLHPFISGGCDWMRVAEQETDQHCRVRSRHGTECS